MPSNSLFTQDLAKIFASHLSSSLHMEMISCCIPGEIGDPSSVCHLWYDLDMDPRDLSFGRHDIRKYAEGHAKEIAGMISRRCGGASSIRFVKAEARWMAAYRGVGIHCNTSLAIEGNYDVVNDQILWCIRMAYEILPAKPKIGDTINIRTPPRFRVRTGPNFNP